MDVYEIKPALLYVAAWDGTDTDPLIADLHSAGWRTMIQAPEQETIEEWDWESIGGDHEKVTKPCPARLLIVGPKRGQLWQLDQGRYLTWAEDEHNFGTMHGENDLSRYWQATGRQVTLPTPEQLAGNDKLKQK